MEGSELCAPEYEIAYNRFIGKAVDGIMREDPLLSGVTRQRSRHSGGSINFVDEKELHFEGQNLEALATISKEGIRQLNVEEHDALVGILGANFCEGMKAMMYSHTDKLSEATGNTINANGEKLSPEMLLKMLDKIHWTFTKEAEVSESMVFVFPQKVGQRVVPVKEILRVLVQNESHRDAVLTLIHQKHKAFLESTPPRKLFDA